MVQWAVDNDHTREKHHVCNAAAQGGHERILRWALQSGYPITEWASYFAAREGHLDILKICREHGVPDHKDAFNVAIQRKQYHVCEWMIENEYVFNMYSYHFAVESEHYTLEELDILKATMVEY